MEMYLGRNEDFREGWAVKKKRGKLKRALATGGGCVGRGRPYCASQRHHSMPGRVTSGREVLKFWRRLWGPVRHRRVFIAMSRVATVGQYPDLLPLSYYTSIFFSPSEAEALKHHIAAGAASRMTSFTIFTMPASTSLLGSLLSIEVGFNLLPKA
jgi:hypothetical protein